MHHVSLSGITAEGDDVGRTERLSCPHCLLLLKNTRLHTPSHDPRQWDVRSVVLCHISWKYKENLEQCLRILIFAGNLWQYRNHTCQFYQWSKQCKCGILQTSSGNAGHVRPVPKVYGPQDFKKMDTSTAWHVAGYSSFQSVLQYMQTVLYGFTGYGHKLLGELFSPISGSANFWCQLYYHGQMKRQQVRVNTIFFFFPLSSLPVMTTRFQLVHKVSEFTPTTVTR